MPALDLHLAELALDAGAHVLRDGVHAPGVRGVGLGALVCVPRQPLCPACPVQRYCRASEPAMLPNICKTRSESRSPSRFMAGMTSDSPSIFNKSARVASIN
mgnify:CR=1 FL=1